MILRPPALDEGHPDGAHFGQLVDSLEAMVDTLCQKGRKLLVIEYLEAAAGRNLADGGGVEPMVVVAVPALYEDSRVGETLRVHLVSHVVQVHSLTDVAP